MTQLVLVRGLPGSGKSTLARHLKDRLHYKHYEADMFFEWPQEGYIFDATLLPDAHKWCIEKTEEALSKGESVVVSNTFVTRRDMQAYFDLADKYHLKAKVIECKENFGSVHNVPKATIERMQRRWEN